MKIASSMKLTLMASVLAMTAAVSPAVAGDELDILAYDEPAPLPFDVLFGTKLATDYILRSVSQTQGNPALQGYAEINLKNGLYGGFWASNVDYDFATDPYIELDWYAGIRHTWNKLTLDGGYLSINYLGEDPGHDLDFWKVYGIATYALTDNLTVGANYYWTNSFVGFNGIEGPHGSLFGKLALPEYGLPEDIGTYVSGEVGQQWIGDNFVPEYTYWNAGFGFTYEAATLDFRYTGATLSDRECALFIGQADSCGNRYMMSLSFDTAFSKLR